MSEVIIVAIISSGALSALISGIFLIISNRMKEDEGIKAGMKMLLYDRIKHLGKFYIHRGNVTLEELNDLHDMHEIYHDQLGGNGFLDSLMHRVESLPIKADDLDE